MRRVAFAGILASLTLSTPLFADEAHSFRFFGPSGAGKTTVMTVLHEAKLPKRLAMNSPEGPKIVFVFDGQRNIIVVNDRDREIIDMAEMAGMMKAMGLSSSGGRVPPELEAAQDLMRSKMKEILDKTPEAQRDMVRKALEAQMGVKMDKPKPAGGGAVEFESTGDTDRINAYDVARWLVTRDGDTVGEAWVTDPADIEGGPALIAAFAEAGALMSEILGDMASGAMQKSGANTQQTFVALAAVNGFPIQIRDEAETWTYEGPGDNVDDLDFAAWADYKRRTLKP
jgi:hypothetical protein